MSCAVTRARLPERDFHLGIVGACDEGQLMVGVNIVIHIHSHQLEIIDVVYANIQIVSVVAIFGIKGKCIGAIRGHVNPLACAAGVGEHHGRAAVGCVGNYARTIPVIPTHQAVFKRAVEQYSIQSRSCVGIDYGLCYCFAFVVSAGQTEAYGRSIRA